MYFLKFVCYNYIERWIMKILRIAANNFKLCEDNFTISFVPIANKTVEDKEFELHEIAPNLFTYKTLAFIGKNASGKTTAVELLSLVYDIFSNFRIKLSVNLFKYFDSLVSLDVTFYHDGYLYRYKTDLFKNKEGVDNSVILFKNQELYRRLYKKTYAKNLFDFSKYERVNYNYELPEDTSIIYMLLKNINYRGIYLSSNDLGNYSFDTMTNIYKLFINDEKITNSILKIFDEHLEKIELLNENKFLLSYSDKTSKELTYMELLNILSSGTVKGLSLFTFVVFSLKNGTDLIIDEIENHFHKSLVENLVNLYKDKSVNKHNATLIFTTHYCELLDLFNRSDNIYITKYNKKIQALNLYENYKFRPELSKSKKFYSNAFDTDINYEYLMNFKKELMR